jgi:dipeptide/tripeptide permease
MGNSDGALPSETRQLGLFAAIASLSYVFWVVGGMEMVERLAYYGVKAVATLYAKDPVSKGGLGVTMSEFGNLLFVWALVQSVLPVCVGGLADRYGYKETIAISTVVKICGYLVMFAFPTYSGFFAGAMLLAAGTAIFKPGIQGTLVKATRPENSSMAWGIFYQTVNWGGFLGPLVAGYMRKMEWKFVFLACAGIIALNFLLLLTYKEPGKAERLARAASGAPQSSLLRDSLTELARPHVWTYLLVFSGFWFMFNALFDVLPVYIDEWVDSSDIIGTLFPSGRSESPVVNFLVVTNDAGTHIQPEGLLNLNAFMIMLTCFLFAWISGLMRPVTSMVVGTACATLSLFAIGHTSTGWWCLAAIAIFSVGEMLSSPKFSEFVGNFAPADKKAMYLGFSQIPLAIGWSLEGKLGPWLYDQFASREQFAREMLLSGGLSPAAVDAVPQGEAFTKLVEVTGQAPDALVATMRAAHDVSMVWDIMGVVGVLSALGIFAYGKLVVDRGARATSAK